MKEPDYRGAIDHARQQLQRELSPELLYHSVAHTFDDVLPAAIRLARLSGLDREQTELLKVAAAFHDIGYTCQFEAHEEAGAEIARNVLPNFGFDAQAIEAIVDMILATRLPQSPRTLPEQILADADLDVLGRPDFWERDEALREEMASLGEQFGNRAWYERQLRFLLAHRYFTPAARALRGEQKQIYVDELRERLAGMEEV